MNLKKLPPSMLMALGLGCVAEACLSPPYDPTESSTSGGTNTVGPCLSPPLETTAAESTGGTDSGTVGSTTMGMTTGPCLSPPEDSSGGTSTGTGDGSGTAESGSGSGGMEAPPASRAEALRRVLDRGALPPDVAARLRGRE